MFTPNRSYQASGGSGKNRRSTVAGNLFFEGRRKSSLTTSGNYGRRISLLTGRSPRMSFDSAANSPTLNMTLQLHAGEHSVTSFGSSLPVKVLEILSEVEDVDSLSVQLNENGWAWLIHNRKLLIWRFKQVQSKVMICKEFLLPKLDNPTLEHQSKLVHVYCNRKQSDDVSLLVASPEGHVMFWPSLIVNTAFKHSIIMDGVSLISSIESQLIKLVSLKDSSCYAALSNRGNIFVIYPSKNSIQYVKVQQSSGMLAGIGRRMTMLFFTPSEIEESVDITVLKTKKRDVAEIVVLSKTHFQKWKIDTTQNGSNECVAHTSFNGIISDDICVSMWNSQESNFRYWPLRVAACTSDNALLVLFAVTNSTQSHNTPVKFCLVLCPQSVFNQCRVSAVYPLEHLQLVNDVEELKYDLIVPLSVKMKCDFCVVVNKNFVLVKELSDSPESKLPFDSGGDSIIGSGKYNSECILLSAVNCLLVLGRNDLDTSQIQLPDSFLENSSISSSSQQISLNNSDAEIPSLVKGDLSALETNTDFTQRLKAAFIYYNKKDIEQAKDIVDSTFSNDFDNSLDRAVVDLSQTLIDDHPAQDPRWTETLPDSTGSSNSLLLQHQLKDKAQAHELFIRFLNDVDIMDKLTIVSTNFKMPPTSTRWILYEHGEKLAAANALRLQHAAYPSVVDVCIKSVMNERMDSFDNSGLTSKDLFYREVSKLDEIIPMLVVKEEQLIKNSQLLSPKDIVMHIMSVNDIIQAMISAAYEYRRLKNFRVAIIDDQQYEFIPWTVEAKSHSIRDILVQQHKITLERGITEAQDGQQRAAFHANLVQLVDFVLHGYKEQLESILDNAELENRRTKILQDYDIAKNVLISPLINLNVPEKAAYLGEKYQDFGVLVVLCDNSEDNLTVTKYINKFSDDGFCEFLFAWYIENNKANALLTLAQSGVFDHENADKLALFFQDYPQISWFHQIESDQYIEAHETLQKLAQVEKSSLLRKKQYLGLSKMSCLFSDETDDEILKRIEALDSSAAVLEYQENLPLNVLRRCKYDEDSMPVLEVNELIDLYIGKDNINSNEIDYKKALELLQFIPDYSDTRGSKVEDMKTVIWCHAVLKNSWNGIDSSSHILHACSHTVLFKLLQLVYESGMVKEAIPNIDDVLDHQILGNLRQESSFQYIIRALFEEYNRTVSTLMEH